MDDGLDILSAETELDKDEQIETELIEEQFLKDDEASVGQESESLEDELEQSEEEDNSDSNSIDEYIDDLDEDIDESKVFIGLTECCSESDIDSDHEY